MAKLEPVLAHIEGDFGAAVSVYRFLAHPFDFDRSRLRRRGDTRLAPGRVPALGFTAELLDFTKGHPHSPGPLRSRKPHRTAPPLLRPLRRAAAGAARTLGKPAFRALYRGRPPWQARRCTRAVDDKGQVMTFLEAFRAWKAVAWRPAGHGDGADRGRGGKRQRLASRLPGGSTPPRSARQQLPSSPTPTPGT